MRRIKKGFYQSCICDKMIRWVILGDRKIPMDKDGNNHLAQCKFVSEKTRNINANIV